MHKMTSEEYVETLRLKMLEEAQGIIDESVDIPKACISIYEFLSDESEYSARIAKEDMQQLKLIWGDLYEFAQDEERLKLTSHELAQFDKEGKKTVDFYKESLKDICRKILSSDIPNMRAYTEDPLSWPYSDDVW